MEQHESGVCCMKGNMEERACALAAYIIENRPAVMPAAVVPAPP